MPSTWQRAGASNTLHTTRKPDLRIENAVVWVLHHIVVHLDLPHLLPRAKDPYSQTHSCFGISLGLTFPANSGNSEKISKAFSQKWCSGRSLYAIIVEFPFCGVGKRRLKSEGIGDRRGSEGACLVNGYAT